MTRQLKIISLFLMCILFGCTADKIEKKPLVVDPLHDSFFTFFEKHAGHLWTLSTDLDALVHNKETEEYYEASLVCKNNDMLCFQLDLKVSSRGMTRKKYCNFPPLKLNFNKTALENKELNRFDHYKLVTHCNEDEGSEATVLREYLVYKLYNELSPNSLNASLMKITYEDSKNKMPSFEKYAFLIEPIEELCFREQLNPIDNPSLKLKSVDAEQYKLFTLFQYMIGNTDWNLSKRHNAILVQKEGGQPFPVPYDFDYSGLVDAPYAVPHPQLPIKNIRERLFQYRAKNPDLTEAIQLFKQKKESLFNLCNQCEFLDEANRKDLLSYIESFYEIIEDSSQVQEKLIDKK